MKRTVGEVIGGVGGDDFPFDIGRSLSNLSALRKIGFEANRRLLRVEQLSHDCLIGEGASSGRRRSRR